MSLKYVCTLYILQLMCIIYTYSIVFSVETALLKITGSFFEVSSGETIAFNCTADGINRPVIMWRRNGQLILNTPRLSISNVNSSPGFRSISGLQQITSSLTIRDLRESDSANYSCRADNEAGIPVSLDIPFMLTVHGIFLIIYKGT